MKIFLFLLLAASIFGVENLVSGDYNLYSGFLACIACHVPRANNDCMGPECLPAPLTCATATIAFNNFPKTLSAGQQFQANVQLLGMGVNQKSNVMLVDPSTGLNIKDAGWGIVRDPAGTLLSFLNLTPGQNSLIFQLTAPKRPGTYVMEAALHGAQCNSPHNRNTWIRWDYDTVAVSAVSEAVAPAISAAGAGFHRSALVVFSEPVQPAEAKAKANYQVTRSSDGAFLGVDSVALSPDCKTATLYLTNGFENGKTYSVLVKNVKDFAVTPNAIGSGASKAFTVNRPSTFTLYPANCLDCPINADPKMRVGSIHCVGKDPFTGEVRRGSQWWELNLPPGETILSVKLQMRQDTAVTSAAAVAWDIYRLRDTVFSHFEASVPAANWWWNGLNQSANPIATLTKNVTFTSKGNPAVWWEWDLTADFKNAYLQGEKWYAIREKLAVESGSVPGVFFSTRVNSIDPTKWPRLLVTVDSAGVAAEKHPRRVQPGLFLTASPNPFRQNTVISLADWKPGAALSIFDASGRLVQRASIGPSGTFRWKAEDAFGRPLAPGLFLVRLAMGSHETFRRLALIR